MDDKNRVIVFANQKGGVGKSTLCILFADYLAEKRLPVAVIDADIQQTIMVQRQRELETTGQDVEKVPWDAVSLETGNLADVKDAMAAARSSQAPSLSTLQATSQMTTSCRSSPAQTTSSLR